MQLFYGGFWREEVIFIPEYFVERQDKKGAWLPRQHFVARNDDTAREIAGLCALLLPSEREAFSGSPMRILKVVLEEDCHMSGGVNEASVQTWLDRMRELISGEKLGKL